MRLPRVPQHAVVRDEASKLLDQDAPLTVVRAEQGFGKTTAVAAWAHRFRAGGRRVLWVDLDRDARTAADLWTAFARALEPLTGTALDPDGKPADAGSARQHVRRVLGSLTEPLTVVLDDYRLPLGDSADRDLVDLVRQVDLLHLVVCLREVRPRFWSRGGEVAAVDIGPDVLALDAAEAAELARLWDVQVDDEWLERAVVDWRGWAGLLVADLVDLGHPGGDGAAKRGFVRDVLDDLDPELRALLTANAAGVQLDSHQARAVLGETLDEGLDRLRLSGLLAGGRAGQQTPLAVSPRLRALVSDVLLGDPGEARAVHRRVAAALAAGGHPVDAAEHATAGEDWSLLVELVDANWITFAVERAAQLQGWLAQMPSVVIEAHPRLVAARDQILVWSVDPQAGAALARAERVGDPAEFASTEPLDVLGRGVGQMLLLRSTGDILAAREVVDHGRGYAASIGDGWMRIETSMRAFLHLQWGITLLASGDLKDAAVELTTAVTTGQGSEVDFLARNAAGDLAFLHALEGDSAAAKAALERARTMSTAPGQVQHVVENWEPLAEALVLLGQGRVAEARSVLPSSAGADRSGWAFEEWVRARVAHAVGDDYASLVNLERASALHPQRLTPGHVASVLHQAATFDHLLALGQVVRAENLLARASSEPMVDVRRARLALWTGQDAVARMIATALVWSDACDLRSRLDALLVQAVANDRLGHVADADEAVERALALIERTSSPAAVCELPRSLVEPLAARNPALLAVVEAMAAAGVSWPERGGEDRVALSERELAVLVELATTSSHAEVATRLFVSVNTVKTQVRSIYRKLGVNRRDDALVAARAQGFILDV